MNTLLNGAVDNEGIESGVCERDLKTTGERENFSFVNFSFRVQ
jgi:hypothetical protein